MLVAIEDSKITEARHSWECYLYGNSNQDKTNEGSVSKYIEATSVLWFPSSIEMIPSMMADRKVQKPPMENPQIAWQHQGRVS